MSRPPENQTVQEYDFAKYHILLFDGEDSALFARQLFHRGAFATVKLHNMEQTPLNSAVLVCDREKSTDVNNVVE